MACDAAMAPFVTGEVNPDALDDLVRLCVDLDRLRHHPRTGQDGTGGSGSDGGGTTAPATTGRARPARHHPGLGGARARDHRQNHHSFTALLISA